MLLLLWFTAPQHSCMIATSAACDEQYGQEVQCRSSRWQPASFLLLANMSLKMLCSQHSMLYGDGMTCTGWILGFAS